MNKNFLTKSVLAGAVLLAALSSVAQTPNSTAPATTQAPTAIGTTPQTAAEATQKAVPRSDTGSVVRTAPSAVDQARSMSGSSTSSTTNAGADMSANSTTPMGTTGTKRPPRAPRADRN